MTSQKSQKIAILYECKNCHYNTSNKYDYKKHLTTQKHKTSLNTYTYAHNHIEISQHDNMVSAHVCECGNNYKHRQSLNNHKKKCNKSINVDINPEIINDLIKKELNEKTDLLKKGFITEQEDFKDLMFELMKQNKDMQEMMFQQSKEYQKQINDLIPKIGNNNTINNNQNYNINIFLNENCKDAISINDFVNRIEISIEDLMLTKNKGLIAGISNILLNELNKLPLTQRPVWCSDKKRKRLFIKEDKWTEDIDNNKTKGMIVSVSRKQSQNLTKFPIQNPNWMESDNLKDTYMRIIKNSTDDIDDKTNKIIDNMINIIHMDDTKNKIILNDN